MKPIKVVASKPKFVKLDEGVQVLRLFQTHIPTGGEVAILRLSADQYKRFKEGPKKFVNETYEKKIFLFEVRDVVPATYKGQTPLDSDAKQVTIVLCHDPSCIDAYLEMGTP